MVPSWRKIQTDLASVGPCCSQSRNRFSSDKGTILMKTFKIALALVLVLAWPLLAAAQSEVPSHPYLGDDFMLGAGLFFPSKNFEINVNGTTPHRQIDFEDTYKIDDSETTGALDFRWRFGKKWSVQGQYWTVGDSGTSVLDRDVEWRDIVFKQGTNASASVDLDVARLFFGRKFSSSPQHEFGLGVGLHWLKVSANVDGQILTSVGDEEFYEDSVSADSPLPNFGAWYIYSWSPKWALTTRFDWLSVTFDEYSGSLWNASVGVNWAPFEHVGFGASWNVFGLDVDVDKSEWQGSAEISQSGPFLSVTAYW